MKVDDGVGEDGLEPAEDPLHLDQGLSESLNPESSGAVSAVIFILEQGLANLP